MNALLEELVEAARKLFGTVFDSLANMAMKDIQGLDLR
jgi:hypothetical protein